MEIVSDIRLADETDAQQVWNLADRANAFSLQKSGEVQWTPDFGLLNIYQALGAGKFHVVEADRQIVAGVVIEKEDPDIWGAEGLDGRAFYVHKLMADPESNGIGLGRHLIRFAADEAIRDGRELLRLDCRASQIDLRRYYERLGFEHKRYLEPSSAKYGRAALYQIGARQYLESYTSY